MGTDAELLAEQADIERTEAELRHLVDAAREHTEVMVCEYAGTCAGDVVDDVLEGMTDGQLHSLLYLAVARLAATGYGRDVDADDPARVLLAGLDMPEVDDDGR
jgi:hypothetical protein